MDQKSDNQSVVQFVLALALLLCLNHAPTSFTDTLSEESKASVKTLIIEFVKTVKNKNILSSQTEQSNRVSMQSSVNKVQSSSLTNNQDSRASESFIVHALEFLHSVADCFDDKCVSSLLGFAMIVTGHFPKDAKKLYAEQFELDEFDGDNG